MNRLIRSIIFTVNICLLPYTGFATTLGHITVANQKSGTKVITYENIHNYAVAEGDIILGRADELSAKHASILSSISGGRWPQGVVPFEISEDLPMLNKLSVLQAIVLIEKKTNVHFVELTSKNRLNYPNYITFVPAYDRTCASFVGMQKKGPQDIVLAPRCETMNTVHEIGHALGLWHEQSRTDRDNYIRIAWENIEDIHRFNFEQHLSDGEDFGEYDYDSIMHYQPYAFSKNGHKTIIPLKDNVEIGQRSHLSEKDIEAINTMYPVY